MHFLSALFILCAIFTASVTAQTSPDYYASLARFEGVRLTPYREKNGDWSVGIGHNLTAHRQPVKPRYTQDGIRDFFDRDLAAALRAARVLVKGFDDLPNPAKEVVVHLIFQCGPTGFARFKALRLALSKGAWNAAATELWDSKWFRQTPAPRANWALNNLQSLSSTSVSKSIYGN